MPDNTPNELNNVLGESKSVTQVTGNDSLETQRKQTELINEQTSAVKEHTSATKDNTSAIKDNMSANKEQARAAVDSDKKRTSSYQKLSQEIKANNDKIIESNREVGLSAVDMAKKETQALEQMNKERDDFGGKVKQILQLVKGFADNTNQFLVGLNKTVIDTTNSMGAMASSTGDILSGQVKLGGQLKNVNLSYGEMNDAIGKISISGRITNEEAQRLFTSLTAVGVSARDVNDIFTNTSGALGLINSGFLKTEEASSLVQDAITGMGKSAEVAERQMMGIVAITTKLNDSFGKGTFSTHQMAKEILSLQQSLRFIETDLERLPVYLANFAGAAKNYQKATGKGISQEAAIQLGKQQMGATASMDIAHASFLGQKAGLGPGLLGGDKFFGLDPQKRVSVMKDVLLKQSGMDAISDEEMERTEKIDPVRAAELAGKRQLQVELMKKFSPGIDDQKGRKLLNLYSQNADAKTIGEELKTDEQKYKDDVRKNLEASKLTNEAQTQTLQEWRKEWQDYIKGKAQSATGGMANIVSGIVSAAANLGLLYLQFRGLGKGLGLGSAMNWAKGAVGKGIQLGKTVSRATGLTSLISKIAKPLEFALKPLNALKPLVAAPLAKLGLKASWLKSGLKGGGTILAGADLAYTGYKEFAAASRGDQAEGRFGGKNRSAYSLGGIADDMMTVVNGAIVGGKKGPIGAIVGAVTAAAGLATARTIGAQVARGQARDSLREGVDIQGQVFGKSGSKEFKDFARSHSDTYKDIAESNQRGWWRSNKNFEETYGGASSEQKTAMDDAFKAYIDASQKGDKNEAKRYMGQISSFISPETKTIDALNIWLKQNRKDLGTVTESASGDFNDITRVIGARENSWDAGLDEKQKEDVDRIGKAAEEGKLEEEIKKKKAEEAKKKEEEPINLTAVTNLDGVVIARAVAKHLMSGGIFAPGNNANLAGVG